MTSEQLEAFLAVADAKSFSEAAVRLFTTQPTISRQVRALETELGTELFFRYHKRVELTPAGQQVYDFALERQQKELALMHALSLRQGGAGHIRLAMSPSTSTPLLYRSIRRFCSLHPQLRFSLQEALSPEIPRLLERGGCELAVGQRDYSSNLCDCLELYEDRFVLALPKDHPLAGNGSISVKRLEHEPLLLLASTAASHQMLLSLCRQEGFVPEILFSGQQLLSILEQVRGGFGIAFLWRRSIPTVYYDQISVVELSELASYRQAIVLMRLKSRPLSPHAEEFWSFMSR